MIMKNILVIHGPNLNLLGERETEIYGSQNLAEINGLIEERAAAHDIECRFFQSNHEGEILDTIHENRTWMDGHIINPGALSHTSIALLDALSALPCPIIEVHLSNIYKRESFRHRSYISQVVTGGIFGLGSYGYLVAVDVLKERLL
jgi:3-dehydroquinate dehydratase-2